MSTPTVDVSRVSRRFGSTRALRDVSFRLQGPGIHGLLGRNGAGKTTLMAILTGQDRPTAGRVSVFGRDPFESSDTLERISFVRDNQRYPEEFRLPQILAVGPVFYPHWDARLALRIASAFRIPRATRLRGLSRGQLSAVSILIGMASRAPLTLFDEPYLGLDASARATFYELLARDFARHPRTFIVSTHLIDEMEPLLERVLVLDRGRLALDATTEDLADFAYRISGPAPAVRRAVAGREVWGRRTLGSLAEVTVRGAIPSPDQRRDHLGVAFERASLQDIVAGIGAAPSVNPDDLSPTALAEGAPR